MTKKVLKTLSLVLIAATTIVEMGCTPQSLGTSGTRTRDSQGITGTGNVGVGQGRVLLDNPIVLTNNYGLADTVNLNALATITDITTNTFLTGTSNCLGLTYCFEVRADRTSPSPLQSQNGKWDYASPTPEFLQTSTYYHLLKMEKRLFQNMLMANTLSAGLDGNTSLPATIVNPMSSIFNFEHDTKNPLIAYANCDAADNAYFDRANFTLCFGFDSTNPAVKFSHDSSVIYHELGHYFQKLQLNFRNPAATYPVRAEMGTPLYEESGSLGEGLSDFFSYYQNGRPHFAEWAAGRYLKADRPMSEADYLYNSVSISTDPTQRLSYPQFLTFMAQAPTSPIEDIHVSGMIISHYLTAQTEDLVAKCGVTNLAAREHLLYILTETMAELGDLSTKGTNNGVANTINLSPTYANKWMTTVNPINYRSFTQTFAKNLLRSINANQICSGLYTKDNLETLLDSYGLLLFRTYNNNRNNGIPGDNTTLVSGTNRQKSALISKNMIGWDPAMNSTKIFIVDNQSSIAQGVASMKGMGVIKDISGQTPSDFGYNNGNGRVSPGEVVGIAVNLYNNSNSTVGGVQILANDWNHADVNGSPYLFPVSKSNDLWPLASEGGVTAPLTTSASVATDFAPVCFMQTTQNNATTWVSQSAFQTKLALSNSMCLNPNNNKDCFIRSIKDSAYYSKIDPKKTWGQTLADPATGQAPQLSWGNMLVFEVSKHIPPGTTIDCRLRVRFTNCEECFHDANRQNYDYKDVDYNGPVPYKVMHMQFTVID